MKSIILLSGGLDSAVSLALALRKGLKVKLALTFDYGQKSAGQEIRSARFLCRRYHIKHQVFNLKWLGKLAANPLTDRKQSLPHPSSLKIGATRYSEALAKDTSNLVWIPNRNALFINIAASFAEALGYRYIITGFNKEEAVNFPDNSIPFINAVNQTLKYSTLKGNVKVVSFTAKMNKKQMTNQARRLGLPLDKLWSCYEGGKTPCGVCESCLRRSNV
ncbi:MAG TPA: 7-cyano-7-deazaguanine synthase QueC [Planctomycetota bacterium]|nr:7-cyano-7-deazaguanine synthase QueC [Planctomycetota bacterium]